MTRTIGKMSMLALAFCGYASLAGCNAGSTGSSSSITSQGSTGDVSFALTLVPGVTLPSATYTITGPGGFSRTGTINLTSSSTLSALISGLPAGMGYAITISSTASDGVTTCGGS